MANCIYWVGRIPETKTFYLSLNKLKLLSNSLSVDYFELVSFSVLVSVDVVHVF